MDEPRGESQPSPSFEEALENLDAIVEELESEDITLDRLVDRYDEGMKLLSHCQKRLAEAKLRITMVDTTEPDTDADNGAQLDTRSNADDIELF